MTDLPSGLVTFVFTDVESSTRLFQMHGAAYETALGHHREILRRALAQRGGVHVSSAGDGLLFAFADAAAAIEACCAAQEELEVTSWPADCRLRVRMGMHTGEAVPRDSDYLAIAVHQAARVADAGHGGQVLVSTASRRAAGDALSEDVVVQALGEYVLKDFERPQTLFQATRARVGARFPELRTARAAGHNLPPERTRFHGRETELAELRELLFEHRLVTVSGPGGVGKTRLAREVGASLREVVPHGVWLVALAPLADPALVLPAVAAVLGVREEPGRTLGESVGQALGDRSPLIILDNCEHLLDAAADAADDLLSRCPRVRVLATTRQMLGVVGEVVWRIPALATAEGAELLRSRVADVRPSAVTEPGADEAIRSICAELDGLPLAIELAAVRARSLSLAQLAARLGHRFALLDAAGGEARSRHGTLSAMVRWSYDALEPDDQVLLRRLSVFSGGWTLEDAERVCAGEELATADIVPGLDRLVERSLIDLRPTEHEVRYEMLQTIRAFARDELEAAGEVHEAAVRHVAWAEHLAEEAFDGLEGEHQVAWLRRLDAEHSNLLEALGAAREPLASPERVLALAGACSTYWWMRRRPEARAWLRQALDDCPDGPAALRLRALAGLGYLLKTGGDLEAAADVLATARELVASADLAGSPNAVLAVATLGDVLARLGRDAEALEQSEAAVALAERLGDPASEALAHGFRGNVLDMRGSYDEAERSHRRCLDRARAAGHTRLVAFGLLNLSASELRAGRSTAAVELGGQAVSLIDELGADYQLPMALVCLGDAERAAGHPEDAASHYLEAWAAGRLTLSALDAPWSLWGLASVLGEDRAELAAHCVGAAERRLAALTYTLLPDERAWNERTLDRLRSALGEDALAAGRLRGAGLSDDDLAALLDDIPRA